MTFIGQKTCEECGKTLILKKQRDLLRKRFCSHHCQGKHFGRKWASQPDFAVKFIAAGQTPEVNSRKGCHGPNHPRWNGGISRNCLWCLAPFKTAKNTAEHGHGKYCSKGCFLAHHTTGIHKRARIASHCLACQKPICNTPSRAKIRKFCSRTCAAVYGMSRQKSSGTKIENSIEILLNSLNVPYEKQKPLLGLTVADFFVTPNVAIYADGNYWHGLEKTKNRDAKINVALTKAGFRVVRFSEGQIYENIKIVKNRLQEECHAKRKSSPTKSSGCGIIRQKGRNGRR